MDDDDTWGRTRWFGAPWPSTDRRAPVCEDDAQRVPTPLNEDCMMCGHPIRPDDSGCSMPHLSESGAEWKYTHRVCMLRMSLGCSAHLRGEAHDESLDYYQDALLVEAWLAEHGLPK